MFGFAEVIHNLEYKGLRDSYSAKIRDLLPTRSDFKQAWKPIIRGTGLGALFGILPGAPWLKGVILGLILWILSQTVMPMMMGMPMFANMMAVMASLMSHAIYGALLGGIAGDKEGS